MLKKRKRWRPVAALRLALTSNTRRQLEAHDLGCAALVHVNNSYHSRPLCSSVRIDVLHTYLWSDLEMFITPQGTLVARHLRPAPSRVWTVCFSTILRFPHYALLTAACFASSTTPADRRRPQKRYLVRSRRSQVFDLPDQLYVHLSSARPSHSATSSLL